MSDIANPTRRRRILLEVCVASLEDAVIAAENGADRLELNTALALGGLTPSLGTLIEVRRAVRVPVIVMARPRPGGFCYTPSDWAVMRRDIDLALEHGADGVAFGVLTADGHVDVNRCAEVVRALEPSGRAAVFHRAFDFVPDPLAALGQLIDVGVRRVMTSGQQPTAAEGVSLIAQLVGRVRVRGACGPTEILPAGGIRPWNVADLIARTGCVEVHAAFREPRTDESLRVRPRLSLETLPGPGESIGGYDGTSGQRVREMVNGLSGPDPREIS